MALFESGEGFDYSTSEVKTGAHWIDGKPVYKKVVTLTATAKGESYLSHGISNISTPISASFNMSGLGILPYTPNDYSWVRSCVFRASNIICNIGSSAPVPVTITAVLEYTKTTD